MPKVPDQGWFTPTQQPPVDPELLQFAAGAATACDEKGHAGMIGGARPTPVTEREVPADNK